MAGTQTLTPVQDVADGAGLNLTALLATPTGTTLLFGNVLAVDVGTVWTLLALGVTALFSVILSARGLWRTTGQHKSF